MMMLLLGMVRTLTLQQLKGLRAVVEKRAKQRIRLKSLRTSKSPSWSVEKRARQFTVSAEVKAGRYIYVTPGYQIDVNSKRVAFQGSYAACMFMKLERGHWFPRSECSDHFGLDCKIR
jgi:hypothetical protein